MGIVARRDQITLSRWSRTASFRHRATRRLQHEVVVIVALDTSEPDVDERERLDYEREDYFGFRWWPVPDVVTSTERFYLGRLPQLLPHALAGEQIDEPFELWS